MIRNHLHIFLFCGLLLSGLTGCEKPLFTQLPAEDTGVTFSNRITENDTMNIIDFEYVYNGGGTAIGDFNGDGRPDLFFTGNQVANRLYLNQTEAGSNDLTFTDVTGKAGVGGGGKWCSGVAVVDINNDGRLDIYVGATVKKVARARENLLYINQGNQNGVPIFREMAREYGIADDGHTTNAAFFDYDNDGDLDLYVLTNTISQYPNAYRTKVTDGSSPTTDRLYRNLTVERGQGTDRTGPLFVNVSKAEGITLEGYGLGLNVCDINRDGWKDVYVTNDYITDDLLYLNQHANGRHTGFADAARAAFKHTSNSAMGNDVADINNDGLADVVAVDMLPRDNQRKKMLMGANNYQTYLNNEEFGYGYQYVRNTLQLNQGFGQLGNGTQPAFSEISLLADVAETDWSWSPLLADFDHDGYRDLLVTNGFPKDITDRDFVSFREQSSSVASKQFMLEQIPVVKISNYAFRNNGADGNLTFTNATADWGMDVPSFSNGAAYGDLDGDGDLDYVVNNINDSAFVFRNNLMETRPNEARYLRVRFSGPAHNRMGLGAFVELHYVDAAGKPQQQVYEHSPYRGYLSTVEPVAHFGLGNVATINEVRISWPAQGAQPARQQTLRNVATNQTLTADVRQAREPATQFGGQQGGATNRVAVAAGQTNATPAATAQVLTDVTDALGVTFRHEEPEYIDFNTQKLLPHKLSQFAPAVSTGDVNGDGLADLFVGGSTQHKGRFLLQTPAGGFVEQDLLPGTDGTAKPEEDMGTLLFDADADGDLDLYVASGSCEGNRGTPTYQDRLYVNEGGRFRRAEGALPPILTSKSCVKAADYDRDGDLDLFVGGRVEPDQYPKPVSSYVLRNDSPRSTGRAGVRFTDVTNQVAPALKDVGLVCDALWTDPDNDGWPDLLLAGEWMPLTLLENQTGKAFARSASQSFARYKGWWNSLVAGDFDQDGDVDYVAGNLGLNARMRATDKEPVRIYAGDLDNNGFYDAIPTIFIPDEQGERREFTFHGRDDLIRQMIVMRKRFPYYKDFTGASIDKLLTDEERKNALVLEANYLQSVYVENQGNGQFALRPLPLPAQLAPIFGMVAQDVDQDGNLDVLLVGNDFSAEVMMGRYDALNGLWLRGDGRGNFSPQPTVRSGFYVPGNARGLAHLTDAQGRALYVATQNRGPLRIFRQATTPSRVVSLRPDDAVAVLIHADGRSERVELSYGQSFLSQSARQLRVGPTVRNLTITNSRGQSRTVPPNVVGPTNVVATTRR